MDDALNDAVRAIETGELVVYPTETVYGLGADALDPDAVESVFDAKHRDRDRPVSMAVPDVEAAAEHVVLTDRERRFVEAFLPGPVTVVVEPGPEVPDVLTGSRERVGVRIPDSELALSLLEQAAPVTATSANVSGHPSARRPADLDREVESAAAVVLDGGTVPGGASTVVDVERGEVLRAGQLADAVREWLDEH